MFWKRCDAVHQCSAELQVEGGQELVMRMEVCGLWETGQSYWEFSYNCLCVYFVNEHRAAHLRSHETMKPAVDCRSEMTGTRLFLDSNLFFFPTSSGISTFWSCDEILHSQLDPILLWAGIHLHNSLLSSLRKEKVEQGKAYWAAAEITARHHLLAGSTAMKAYEENQLFSHIS